MTTLFVGLGAMGAPMARNLIAAGIDLIVHDASAGSVAALVADGGRAMTRYALGSVDKVITMLPNGAVVHDVLLGAEGFARGLMLDALVIDMSSAHPRDTQQTASALAAIGHRMIDAPVSGGVVRATAGELAIMAGGADADVAAAAPLLAPLGKTIHAGPIGAGHAIKALNNLLSATGLAAATEVLIVAKRYGVAPARALEILNASTGRNNATETKFAQFILSDRFDSGFALDLQAKDLAIAVDLAAASATPIAVTQAASDLIHRAQAALGPGRDHTEVARFIAEAAGEPLA